MIDFVESLIWSVMYRITVGTVHLLFCTEGANFFRYKEERCILFDKIKRKVYFVTEFHVSPSKC